MDFGPETPKFWFEYCRGFWGGFFPPVFFSKEEGPKNPPKNPRQNSPRNSVGKIPLGSLQKPSLDKIRKNEIKLKFSSKTKGPEKKGPPGVAPKSFSQKGSKWCSALSTGVIGKSALEIGHFLRRNFWMISGGPILSRPLWFTADKSGAKRTHKAKTSHEQHQRIF